VFLRLQKFQVDLTDVLQGFLELVAIVQPLLNKRLLFRSQVKLSGAAAGITNGQTQTGWPLPSAQTAQPVRCRMKRWIKEPRTISGVNGKAAASLEHLRRIACCFIYTDEIITHTCCQVFWDNFFEICSQCSRTGVLGQEQPREPSRLHLATRSGRSRRRG